jgi:hypothetical protein
MARCYQGGKPINRQRPQQWVLGMEKIERKRRNKIPLVYN